MGDDASAIDNLKKAAELRLKYSQDREASEVENIIALIYHKKKIGENTMSKTLRVKVG